MNDEQALWFTLPVQNFRRAILPFGAPGVEQLVTAQELFDALKDGAIGPDTFIPCWWAPTDEQVLVQVRHIVEARLTGATSGEA